MGSIISAVASIGSSLFGSWAASKAARKAKKIVEDEKKQNDSWYMRRYNEDITQRADAQALLNKLGDELRDRTRAASGTAAVMGTTDASVAATKEAGNKALANATSQIAAQGTERKDKIEEQYRSRNSELNSRLAGIEMNRADSIAKATSGGLKGLANGIDDYMDSAETAAGAYDDDISN